MEPGASEAARALADILVARADALDSTNLDDIVAAIPAIRAAARQLGDLLQERGLGVDILYGRLDPRLEDDYLKPSQIDEELDDRGYDQDEEDEAEAEDEAEELPPNAPRVAYEARFDFVVVDEEALRARAEGRSRQVDPDADPNEGMQEYGGALSLLLYLDNPTFRDYEDAGVRMVHGAEIVRPIERTLDEYASETLSLTVEPRPSAAARALADNLIAHAEALGSTDLADIVAALPAIRVPTKQLGDLLKERGWGNEILFGLPGYDDDDDEDDEDDEDDDDQDDQDDQDAHCYTPIDSARVTYQARFDFVIVDEEALRARAEAGSRQVDPDADPNEGMQEYGGPLSFLLLYLDSPSSRDYESAGLTIPYAKAVVRAVERTLDEYDYDTQDDHFPPL